MDILFVPYSQFLKDLDKKCEQRPTKFDLKLFKQLEADMEVWREMGHNNEYLDFVTITHNRRDTDIVTQYDFLQLYTLRYLRKDFICVYETHEDRCNLHLHGICRRMTIKEVARFKQGLRRTLQCSPRFVKVEPIKDIDNVIKYIMKQQLDMYESDFYAFTNL